MKRRKVKLKPVPVSKAENVLQLCKEVKREILAEPLRANMNCIVGQRSPQRGGPACGTIGCFAGWLGTMLGIPLRQMATISLDDFGRTLFGPYVEMEGPYGEDYSTVEVFDAGTDIEESAGTVGYARAVARRIDRFIAENKTHLQARKLNAGVPYGVRE